MTARAAIRWSFLVATLAAFAQSRAQSAGSDDASVTPLLRAASSAGALDGLRWPRFPYYRGLIDSLYASDGWRPVWIASGRPTREARDALDLLRSAEQRALHSEDYDAALLERRLGELSAGAPASAKDVAWLDMALTVGVLRHLSDVHVGRVNRGAMARRRDLSPLVSDAVRTNRQGPPRTRDRHR